MNITYITSFFYGIVSFVSPCILPMLPVYFGLLSGDAALEKDNKTSNKTLITNAIGFSLGVSLLNILLGFGARFLASPMQEYSQYLRIFGGILLIAFGLYMILDIKIMFFERERKFQFTKYSPTFIKSFILGVTFSFGWTPCNGPIIAGILLIASLQSNYLKAGSLMLVYSLGFTLMFVLTAVIFGMALNRLKSIYKYFNVIKRIAGVIMIIMGILLVTDLVGWLNIIPQS